MKKKIFLTVAMLTLLFLGACKDPVGLDDNLKMTQETTFETLFKGNHSFRFEEPVNFVFRSKSEFNTFMNSFIEDMANYEKFSDLKFRVNQIDFSKDMLICMSRGAKPSSSITFEITRIVNNQDKLFVESREFHPEVGDLSIGYPIHIVAVKRTEGAVEFAETKIVKEVEDDSQLLPFTTIFNKSHGIVSENKIFTVLKSKADESEFLSKVRSYNYDGNGNEIPVTIGDIDYSKDMVIIAHYGSSSSGSNYILIPAIELKDGKITVYSKYYIPYIGTDDIGYPVHIVKLEKRNEPIEFADTEEIHLGESESILQSTSWEWFGYSIGAMEAFFTPEYKNNNKYTMKFDGSNTGSGRLNCNNYGFMYSISDNNLSFKDMVITEAYCGDDLELQYTSALSSAYQYNLSETNLTIVTNHPKYTVLYFRKK
ncbi:MAG: META domain-containing protein [Candidatus Kapabacteria bacterium]|nr:META domain-containing protein [Ignavibacteriota bacterium]MCW5883620.1 META domain-containing protein [Candidatus Kapabacteria bacterium]